MSNALRTKTYGQMFYEAIKEGSLRSARKMVPVVLGLVQPRSVVDVGCGSGTWLRAFKENGVDDVFGVDGGKAEDLQIDDDQFCKVNLADGFALQRRFDLAVCLEVAEHLPTARAKGFVRDLVSLSPAVLFSAAIPGQTGTHHLNEQWPDYWSNIFAEHGYLAFDCVRPLLWNDDEVEWWYRQNTILYLNPDAAFRNQLSPSDAVAPLSLVHPEMLRNPKIMLKAFWRALRLLVIELRKGQPVVD